MPPLFETLIAIVAILVIFGLPLGGLVIRFALRPLVQDIASAIRSNAPAPGDPPQLESLNRRLDRIEQSLLEQEALTTRLLEVQEFDRKLGAGRAEDPGSRAEGAASRAEHPGSGPE